MIVPAAPYRGIRSFRYVDHPIFFARANESERMTSLVSVYRGTMLYGATGVGKSSLINAGLLPRAVELGFRPERVRVQPRAGEALVVERISTAEDGSQPLPSLLAGADDHSGRVVLSTEDFERRVHAACEEHRPLLVFDQFEELCTLFETDAAGEVRRRILDMLMRLLRAPLAVKLLFVFREDYLGKVKELLAACPELIDQALLLAPLAAETLPTIIRGPFERYPRHFAPELDPALAERLRVALAERFGAGELSLSEVQTVCLRLWQAKDPDRLLTEKGVQGLLEDYLGEALDAFPPQTRFAAVALLGQMVTPAGTRNVISAEDLVHRALEEDSALSPSLLRDALDRLDRESRLVRRERRRDLDLYEITSEFLVPWISSRRAEARSLRVRQRERRRLLVLGSIATALLAIAAVVVWLGLEARRERNSATALALSSAAVAQSDKRIDVPLLLALGAHHIHPSLQSRDALMRALVGLRESGASAIMHGHRGVVDAVTVSPDGRLIASAGSDGTVRLWSARTHRQIGAPFEMHEGTVSDVAFTPDGKRLASGADSGKVSIWDLASHHRIAQLSGQEAGVNAVAVSSDGKLLASASYDETVWIWDLDAHSEIGHPLRLPKEAGTAHLAFSPDGTRLLIGTQDGTVQLWGAASHRPIGPPLLVGSEDANPINTVAFSSRGIVASGSEDGTVHFWDAATGASAGDLPKNENGISSLAFSADGLKLAAADGGNEFRLWEVADPPRPIEPPFQNVTDAIEDIAFAPGGDALATADWDGSVRLWSTHQRMAFGSAISEHRGSSVDDVAFSPDRKTLAIAGADHAVRLWSIKDRRWLAPLTGHTGEVKSLAFNRKGALLASGSDDGSVRLWNVAQRKQVNILRSGDGEGVRAVAFSPDGATLAFATNSDTGRIELWDASTGKLRLESELPDTEGVSSLAFSQDGKLIAIGGRSGTILLWSVAKGKRVGRPLLGHTSEVTAVAFSPSDPDLLASASEDETVRLWGLKNRTQLGDPLRDQRGIVYDVAFSPDGSLLASAGGDANAILLWDVESRTLIGAPLLGHNESVRAVAFDSDGTMLASADEGGVVRLWPGVLLGDFDALRDEICHIVGGDLTPKEWARYAPSVSYRTPCDE